MAGALVDVGMKTYRARLHLNLQRARRYGFDVSHAPDDCVQAISHPGGQRIVHFTTLRRGPLWSYLSLPCQVWKPEMMCPCGQVTVAWVDEDVP